jgi:hypothetical protein
VEVEVEVWEAEVEVWEAEVAPAVEAAVAQGAIRVAAEVAVELKVVAWEA